MTGVSTAAEIFKYLALTGGILRSIGHIIGLASSIGTYLMVSDCFEYPGSCSFDGLQKFIFFYVSAFFVSDMIGAPIDIFHLWATIDPTAEQLLL